MRLGLLAALAWPLAAPAQDLALPPGATLAFEAVEAPGSHALATGPFASGALLLATREGAVTRRVWQVPLPEAGPDTTLALMAPLRAQAEAQGLAVLLDCEARTCGGFDFRAAIEVLPPPAMFVDLGDFRYLSAEGEGADGQARALSLLVSRSGAVGFVQSVTVEELPPEAIPPEQAAQPGIGPQPAPAPAGDVGRAAAGLGARIEAEGRVVLDGLSFASGSADLAPGGEGALEALAAWLAQDPARRVAIVGHTDATGPLDANVAVSRRRAEAVAARLRAAPGVARAQVEAEGMGYLAPLATNLTPEGRDRNRRVEAVVLPPVP